MTASAWAYGSDRDPLIVSLSPGGEEAGLVARSVAHSTPGILHRATSVQVIDRRSGGWIIQRRARTKALFAGRWANTSCTHPLPGEDLEHATRRRLREETGLVVTDLVSAGAFTYRAIDPSSGLTEYETDHMFVGSGAHTALDPDPDEIDRMAILPFVDAMALVVSPKGAPWAPTVLRLAHAALGELEGRLAEPP